MLVSRIRSTAGRIGSTAAVAAVSMAVALSGAPAALAAPGDWTQLSQTTNATSYPEVGNIAQPTLARFGSSVQVVWPQRMSSSADSYFTAILDGAGRITTAPTAILSDWKSLTENPTLISLGGQRFLTFSGLNPGRTGAQYYSTSGDGLTWSLSSGSLSETQSAYAAYGSDLVDNAGTPVWVGNPSSTTGITWHVGTSASDPAPGGSDQRFLLGGCCAYNAAAARDAATGAVYAAFYSNASASTENGIQIGQILPSQGAFAQAPGSTTIRDGAADSSDPSQRVAMAARAGGGVFVAYGVGYPSLTSIRLLNVGTQQALDIPVSGNAGNVALAADPAGRLWVTWKQSDKVKAVHTNTAGTALGAIGSWGAPRGTSTMWKTAANAAEGGLDVVVTATTQSAINVWHAQLTRTLSVKAAPSTARRAGSVVFTVTDAGDPVAGAKVRFGGRSATTNASGKATLRAPGSRSQAKVTAQKAGYNTGTTTVRVR